MQSLWNDNEVQGLGSDPLSLRVYTSRLLGREPNLVLHGGGNTSAKAVIENIFGESEDIIYVKGSGGDLISIDRNGFAPIRLNVLKRMAEFAHLTDMEMVRLQRAAMTDPYAPNPSVEAILHAIIPFQFV
ncbi:MAG: class II aldolase/adducin family protein, partial [Candidatus Omnitrophica bacterium]|nr:class II aldolase/adducin family protein [Candidatus Omnitrophota bacterium]